jgi:SAM-dependent methyltransferase
LAEATKAIDAALFDRRGYPTTSAQAGYDEWADTYEASVATGLDTLLLPQLRSITWRQIETVADLGCGTGRTGAWLKARGVGAIDGVDLSRQMLAIAERKRIYRHLAEGDIAGAPLPSGAYRLCIMSLADEHLVELAPAYCTAARLLAPGGQFLLLGYHPFFLMNGLLTHFHRPNGDAVAIRSYVHLFSEHFEAGRQAGLTLIELKECVIDDDWVATKPKWQKYLNWPVSFAAVWTRGEG